MFAPAQGFKPTLPSGANAAATGRTGILGYHAQISDDGKFALVEFIAVSKADLSGILSTSDSRVQLFEKGVHGKDKIEAALKVHKKDFSFDRFETVGVR